jgi:16S rRNA (cytosine967-C5)-methyltransferase
VSAVSSARKAAFDILLAVDRGKAHSPYAGHADDLLRSKAVDALSPADRHLATTLVLGVLRWQIRLDEQLKLLIRKPGAKLDPEVLTALRMGAFQLQFLDRVPAHAAIDESVELTKQSGHRFASGLVNAVLRKLAVERETAANAAGSKDTDYVLNAPGFSAFGKAPLTESVVLGHDFSRAESAAKFERALAPEGASATEIAQAYAHPAWLVERWTHFYGLDATRAICRHGQAQPPRIVRIPDASVEAELIDAGIRLEPGAILTAARTVVSGDVTATAAYREGRVRMQDEGSQLIAELAACVAEDSGRKIESILDACAAPGGKTLILAERSPATHILACESSPQRLAELSKRLAAYFDRVECRLADATALNEESAFDLVLADVPCSGTGTLGRNPEIRHRLGPEDLPRHADRQYAILSAALRSVRPGGRVVYSTCSLEPEENEQVVSAVLAENRGARQISLASHIEALAKNGILTPAGVERLRNCLTEEGALRLLPGKLDTDGFFVALIEKNA